MLRALLTLTLLASLLGGCGTPKNFVRTMEPTWAQVPLNESVNYEAAWGAVVDILAKRFDLEMVDRDNGYVRTAWLYTWTGELQDDYRVRAVIKFSADKSICQIKSEAHYGGEGGWILGTDESLLTTLKTDIMGMIGRTTR